MPTYIVTYEIASIETLKKFKEKLKTFVGYCPIHNNAWAITSEKKAVEVRDELKLIINSTDRLFVIRSGTESAWLNSYGEKFDDWLKKYL